MYKGAARPLALRAHPSFFNELEKRLVLRWGFFGVLGLFVILSLLNIGHENIIGLIPLFLVLIVASFLCLFRTTNEILFYVDKMPAISHEIINMLFSLQIIAHTSSDFILFKDALSRYYKYFGYGELCNMKQEENEHNIRLFIDEKIKRSQKNLTVDTAITFLKINNKVPLGIIINMLGILLDNAINASNSAKHPICIELMVVDYAMSLRVSNECGNEAAKKLYKIFEKKYVPRVKNSHMHGHGLSNLFKMTKEYDVDFTYERVYMEKYQCKYISAIIESDECKYQKDK